MARPAVSSRKTTRRLCGYCRGITIEALAAEEGYSYFPSPAEMVKSYNKCDFCEYMLWIGNARFIEDWAVYRRQTSDTRRITLHLKREDFECPCSEVVLKLEGEELNFSTRYYSFRLRAVGGKITYVPSNFNEVAHSNCTKTIQP
jgi:hypothetical protein